MPNAENDARCDCGSWDGGHPGDCAIFKTPNAEKDAACCEYAPTSGRCPSHGGPSAENDVPCPRCGRTWRGQHAQWCKDAVTADNDAPAVVLCREMHPTRWQLRTHLAPCFECQRAVVILTQARVIPPGGSDA